MTGDWADWTHQEVMLNAWGNRYTDIGGGVAVWGEGSYVFVLDVCMVIGQGPGETVPDDGEIAPEATADLSNYIYGVTVIWPEQELIIQKGSGTVDTPTPSDTSASPTPKTTATPTKFPLPMPTAAATAPADIEDDGQPTPWPGILLVAFSGGGLIMYLIYSSIKK